MAKVVLVEDEDALRRMLAEEIEALGHTVAQARDGEEGLEAIRRVRPDVVCVDVGMPKINGFQLKQRLDASTTGPHPKFVFVSGRDKRGDVADGLMLGADHYLTKPVDMDRLEAILRDCGG